MASLCSFSGIMAKQNGNGGGERKALTSSAHSTFFWFLTRFKLRFSPADVNDLFCCSRVVGSRVCANKPVRSTYILYVRRASLHPRWVLLCTIVKKVSKEFRRMDTDIIQQACLYDVL